MPQTPEVTIVIPTLDRLRLLSRHALPSALEQEDVELEVIVVDDGSSDGTRDFVLGLGDERVRVLRHDSPRGKAAARNTGIAEARGAWLALLDDDDLWSPRKLRVQLDAVGTAHWAYTGTLVVDESLRVTDALPLADPETLAEELRHGNVVNGGSSTVLVRTDLLRQVGGFDESLWLGQDWDLWLRLARRPAVACPEYVVATLEHAARSALQDRKLLIATADELLRRSGGDQADRRAAAQWIANEYFRGGRRLQASYLYLRAAIAYRSPGNLPPAVGALFGDLGIRAADHLLAKVGRGSHLDLDRSPPPDPPAWLDRFRQ
jgi:glycosyltransferase involved in cell wall biosynthesis